MDKARGRRIYGACIGGWGCTKTVTRNGVHVTVSLVPGTGLEPVQAIAH